MAQGEKRGRIAFVGLGLHDEDGVSIAGMKEIERADIVFAEVYTSTLSEGSLDRLSKRSGKKIELLDRAAVEDGRRIIESCVGKRVAFLVVGDPMTATTHVDLRLRATMAGLETTVIHGSSVLTAVPGMLGLQHYKFGRTTTLPFPQEGFSPTSPYEVIAENLSRGIHTLVLLDIDADNQRYMTANEGLHLLLDMERRLGRGVMTDHMTVCVVARAGAPDPVVRAGPLRDLLSEDFGPPPHTIVVPGALHFMEKEALDTFGKSRS
ncbi:MAG: diphthine synthase [Thermoplasmata archaeon]